MKTALLHYWLTNMRGGEKALSVLGEMLPDADIFTHALGNALRDDGEWSSWKGHRVTESLIARLPFGRRHPQAYLPLMPAATRALNLNSAVRCWETPFEAIKPGLCSGFAFHPMGESQNVDLGQGFQWRNALLEFSTAEFGFAMPSRTA